MIMQITKKYNIEKIQTGYYPIFKMLWLNRERTMYNHSISYHFN